MYLSQKARQFENKYTESRPVAVDAEEVDAQDAKHEEHEEQESASI